MRHTTTLEKIHLNNSHLTIGVFDGVHRGHQAILRRVVTEAHDASLPAVVLTFHPHPASVLGRTDLKCLSTPEERAQLLEQLGIDLVITHPFNREVASLSALDFMSMLKKHLGLTRLTVGYDFALGKGREGSATRLIEIGRDLGYEVSIVEALSDESGVISSSAIRKLIAVGKVSEAAEMLGRPYTLSGEVVHGDRRGHDLGYPTANLAVPAEKAIPAYGIYACHAIIGNLRYPAAISIGIRPTFESDQPEVRVEAYLLDFKGILYGQHMTLEFVEHLRDELKFPSIESLVAQIDADVAKTRQILAPKNP